jgi:hypothetical protein
MGHGIGTHFTLNGSSRQHRCDQVNTQRATQRAQGEGCTHSWRRRCEAPPDEKRPLEPPVIVMPSSVQVWTATRVATSASVATPVSRFIIIIDRAGLTSAVRRLCPPSFGTNRFLDRRSQFHKPPQTPVLWRLWLVLPASHQRQAQRRQLGAWNRKFSCRTERDAEQREARRRRALHEPIT